jgi:hypothetical protein
VESDGTIRIADLGERERPSVGQRHRVIDHAGHSTEPALGRRPTRDGVIVPTQCLRTGPSLPA